MKKNRMYEIHFKNKKYKEGNFILTGELKNRCTGDWVVDLTDDIIEKKYQNKIKKISKN